jgi:hypothetical protein
VAGKKQAIHVFTLLGDEKIKKPAKFQEWQHGTRQCLLPFVAEAETFVGVARPQGPLPERLAALY